MLNYLIYIIVIISVLTSLVVPLLYKQRWVSQVVIIISSLILFKVYLNDFLPYCGSYDGPGYSLGGAKYILIEIFFGGLFLFNFYTSFLFKNIKKTFLSLSVDIIILMTGFIGVPYFYNYVDFHDACVKASFIEKLFF